MDVRRAVVVFTRNNNGDGRLRLGRLCGRIIIMDDDDDDGGGGRTKTFCPLECNALKIACTCAYLLLFVVDATLSACLPARTHAMRRRRGEGGVYISTSLPPPPPPNFKCLDDDKFVAAGNVRLPPFKLLIAPVSPPSKFNSTRLDSTQLNWATHDTLILTKCQSLRDPHSLGCSIIVCRFRTVAKLLDLNGMEQLT